MKFVAIAFSTLLVGSVTAQGSAANVPECAKPCVNDNLPASCNLDFNCICTDQTFIANISCCVFKACSQSEQAAALDFAKGVCKAATNAQLPASAGCSSVSATSTAASSAAASSTRAPNPAPTIVAPGIGFAGALLGAAVLL